MIALTDYAIEIRNADGSLRPEAEAASEVFASYARARIRADAVAKVVAVGYLEQVRFGEATVAWANSHQAQVIAGGKVRAVIVIVPRASSVPDEPPEAWSWPPTTADEAASVGVLV
jgi:hypothetical protein